MQFCKTFLLCWLWLVTCVFICLWFCWFPCTGLAYVDTETCLSWSPFTRTLQNQHYLTEASTRKKTFTYQLHYFCIQWHNSSFDLGSRSDESYVKTSSSICCPDTFRPIQCPNDCKGVCSGSDQIWTLTSGTRGQCLSHCMVYMGHE